MNTILDCIRSVAKSHAEQVAVICGEDTLRYSELHAQANQLAHAIRDAGGGPDRIVAVCLERSLAMIVALFAVMKSGSAYLPISPTYPTQRIADLLTDSGAALLITDSSCSIPDSFAGRRIDWDDASWRQYSSDEPAVPVSGNDLAYVIYTSGSTGRPKGVAVEHGALANRLLWMQAAYPIDDRDVLIQKTVYTFDVSVWEIFWWAMYGARVVLLPPQRENDVRLVHQLIQRHGITVIHFVPSVLALFMDSVEAKRGVNLPDSLRYVFASGEKLPVSLVNRCNARCRESRSLLVNLYGPTEAAIDVSHYAFPEKSSEYAAAPIGQPIWNTRLYVLGERLEDVLDGEEGELCIAGNCLARGYHNRPELTHDRFIWHPRIPGERIYRTGDLVRRDPATGDIHYIGRRDSQIKLRGLRIELGEIEHYLQRLDGVTEAVALVHELGGNQFIWGFVRATSALHEAEMKRGLSQYLPAYMLPSRIVRVDHFPLSANGKLDRRQLLESALGTVR